jgi:hypothetical protein
MISAFLGEATNSVESIEGLGVICSVVLTAGMIGAEVWPLRERNNRGFGLRVVSNLISRRDPP